MGCSLGLPNHVPFQGQTRSSPVRSILSRRQILALLELTDRHLFLRFYSRATSNGMLTAVMNGKEYARLKPGGLSRAVADMRSRWAGMEVGLGSGILQGGR